MAFYSVPSSGLIPCAELCVCPKHALYFTAWAGCPKNEKRKKTEDCATRHFASDTHMGCAVELLHATADVTMLVTSKSFYLDRKRLMSWVCGAV